MNPRIRGVLGAGAALALVAGIGIGVATSSSAASQRYVTAVAGTGDVTQTYTATGTVSRKNTAEASFSVSGTVKSVKVAVGDEVEAGDTLATLSKGTLRLAVLNATTSVAEAEATLYAAQHPASSTSSSSSSSSASKTSSGSSGATAASVVIDPTLLNEAASRMNLAVLDEADKCNAIFDSILPAASTPTATATATSTATATATATATETTGSGTATTESTPTPTATASATTEETSAAKDDTAATATASASQLAKVLDSDSFTDDQLQACADARAEVILANANLQLVVAQLTGGTGGTGTLPSTPSKKKSSSSSTSVSKATVAKAKASLLSAEQDLATAEQDLADATLVAPISGTVGEVTLTEGDGASSGSITIVGNGNAVVSFELPLTTRELVKVGQEVTVTPAGSSKTLTGKITTIASLETSGTSGDTPTYTTTVSVSDPTGLLASGANASVLIPVKSETNVLRLPASAVTPTGTGTATVEVVDSTNADSSSTVTVETGAVGGGWVQITSGLDAGQIVVLADNTAAIPENQTFRGRTSSSSSASASASAAATAVPTAESSGAASSAPTSSASR